VEQSSVCVIDEKGEIVLETTVDTHPDVIADALGPHSFRRRLQRWPGIGVDAGRRADRPL